MLNQSLIALACGDAYGSYFELEGLIGSKFDINLLPDVSVKKVITDDTKMALILFEHFNKYEKIKSKVLFNSYQKWALTDGSIDGIGYHTSKILLNNGLNKDSQGNGALMRVIPFGIELIKRGYSFEDAVFLMNKDSKLTHKNETIFMINRLALDISINGLDILNKEMYQDILLKLKPGCTAWVINTFYIVLKTLKMKLSFMKGFKYIVSQGGDTDTNCAIYGAIKGAKENIEDEIDINFFLPKVLCNIIIMQEGYVKRKFTYANI